MKSNDQFRWYRWPEFIPSPFIHSKDNISAVLIRVSNTTRNKDGREKVRSVLKEILNVWTKGSISFEESPKGPVLSSPSNSTIGCVSISYSLNDAWLLVGDGNQCGVDAVSLVEFPEWQKVSDDFFPNKIAESLRKTGADFEDFAYAWALYEASLKCHGRHLQEKQIPPAVSSVTCRIEETAIAVCCDKDAKISLI